MYGAMIWRVVVNKEPVVARRGATIFEHNFPSFGTQRCAGAARALVNPLLICRAMEKRSVVLNTPYSQGIPVDTRAYRLHRRKFARSQHFNIA